MVVSFIGRIYQHLRQRQTLSYVVSSTPMGGYYERKFENLHQVLLTDVVIIPR
jgi:hypothetical protein